MQVYPIIGSPFQIETVPASNGVVTLQLVARGNFNLPGAGFAAVLAQINTYLSSSKCTSILRLTSSQTGVAVALDVSGCSYPVLTADVASQVSALTTIVQTAADVSV